MARGIRPRTETRSFPGRLCREEWLEQLAQNVGRDTGAVVSYAEFRHVADIAVYDIMRRHEPRLGVILSPFVAA